uniref:Uncharacterized protein n=1 Tax=Setaria italica TaxID=4555 RepID=K4A494_SETIT
MEQTFIMIKPDGVQRGLVIWFLFPVSGEDSSVFN